jgi:predicted transcriptional regulator
MKKKEKFRLGVSEKSARLDVRITADLRDKVEMYCRKTSKRLTTIVTAALEDFLERNKEQ